MNELENGIKKDLTADNYHTSKESEHSSVFQSCESPEKLYDSNNNSQQLCWEAAVGAKSTENFTEHEIEAAIEALSSGDPNKIVDSATGSTALHLACQDVNITLVKKLVEEGASVHRINAKDRTMIHELVMGYCQLSALDRVFEQNNFVEILTMLIKAGVDLNDVDMSNRTALHYLVTIPMTAERLTEPLKALLMSGARVNIADGVQQTALHMASQKGDRLTVETLLDHGADSNARDSQGQNPLHIAAKGRKHKTVIAKLASCGADVNCQDIGLRTPLHVATKVRHKALSYLII